MSDLEFCDVRGMLNVLFWMAHDWIGVRFLPAANPNYPSEGTVAVSVRATMSRNA